MTDLIEQAIGYGLNVKEAKLLVISSKLISYYTNMDLDGGCTHLVYYSTYLKKKWKLDWLFGMGSTYHVMQSTLSADDFAREYLTPEQYIAIQKLEAAKKARAVAKEAYFNDSDKYEHSFFRIFNKHDWYETKRHKKLSERWMKSEDDAKNANLEWAQIRPKWWIGQVVIELRD